MQQEQATPLTSRSILRFASFFFSGALLSRFSGLGRDICLAYFFGTSSDIAAFFVAYRFSHLARRLFGEGSMHAAFVPLYEELKQKDKTCAAVFFYRIQKLLALFLLALIGVSMSAIYLFLPLLSPSFHLVALYTFYLLPSLLFICLFGLSASVLHSEKRFFLSSASSVSFNLVWIASLPFLSFFPKKIALSGLCLVVGVAAFAQYLTSYLPVRLTHLPPPSSLLPLSISKDYSVKILKALFYGIAGVGAAQINNFLDPFFAKMASSEGPAYLWYAVRIAQLPIGLIAVSFSSALLPTLSSLIKQSREKEGKAIFAKTLGNALFLSIFLLGAMIVLGSQGIQLIYGHGSFAEASVYETSKCLIGYSLGLLPTTFVILLATYFYAYAEHRLTSIASLSSVCTNIFFNAFFVFILGWDAFSIAIATSISAWVNAGALLYFWQKKWGRFPFALIQKKCFLGATLAVAAAAFVFGERVWEGITLKEQFLHYPASTLLQEAASFAKDSTLFFAPIFCFWMAKRKKEKISSSVKL